MNRSYLSFLIILMSLTIGNAQTKRPLQLEDQFTIQRVSDPQISPDGKTVAYVVGIVDKAANRTNTNIWLVPVSGGSPTQLTNGPKSNRHPRWSPDGKSIAFESNRNGSMQLFVVNVASGETKQITDIFTEASNAIWSPNGNILGFVSAVFPEFSEQPAEKADALNKQKQESRDNSKVKARIITKLLYRHWDSWVDDKRQHIFIINVDGTQLKNLTPGDRDAVPTSSTFSTGDDFSFSPDGQEIAYTATPLPVREESWSTNHDILTVNLKTGVRKQLTTNLGADVFPQYSPDGKYIAYRSQSRQGYESDRWQLMLMDRKSFKTKSITPSFDTNVDDFTWASDSKMIYTTAEEKANRPIWSINIDGTIQKVYDNAANGSVNVSSDRKTLVFAHQTMSRPTELWTVGTNGSGEKQLTHVNDEIFSHIELTEPEYVWFEGADGKQVQMWIVKPPFFDAKKKYPLVYWVHGGPQGAFGNSWSYRWNQQLWAAQGYVLALPNPRGSTGFGQQFTEEISKDWGGKVYTDVMNGVAYMQKLPYIDVTKMAAAGASYGGYMMNWMAGHPHPFKTLICHDGVFNFNSMYGVTEETWFDEWEHGIPWENPEQEKFSPHMYAKNFKTPMLVIHGELDFRVPVGEGFSLFTTLQRKGIPSKLLYFPDEGHWVLKPQNSELWHNTIFDWLESYLKK